MENTKALEVAKRLLPVHLHKAWAPKSAVIIQAAIDEATADLRTQLAERECRCCCLKHEDDEGNIGGHEVVGCSGGADYVGDFETGYPRQVMLAPVKGEGQATYYHESVLAERDAQLAAEREGAQKFAKFINTLIEDLFDGGVPDGFELQYMLEAEGFIESVEATEDNHEEWQHTETELGDNFFRRILATRQPTQDKGGE